LKKHSPPILPTGPSPLPFLRKGRGPKNSWLPSYSSLPPEPFSPSPLNVQMVAPGLPLGKGASAASWAQHTLLFKAFFPSFYFFFLPFPNGKKTNFPLPSIAGLTRNSVLFFPNFPFPFLAPEWFFPPRHPVSYLVPPLPPFGHFSLPPSQGRQCKKAPSVLRKARPLPKLSFRTLDRFSPSSQLEVVFQKVPRICRPLLSFLSAVLFFSFSSSI